MNRNPADRPTVADLETQLQPVFPTSLPQKPTPQEPSPREPTPQEPMLQSPVPQPPVAPVPVPQPAVLRPKQWLYVAALFAVLVVSLLVWAGRRSSRAPELAAPAAVKTADSKQPSTPDRSPAAVQPAPPSAKDSHSALHAEIPDIPRSARDTIHGRIKVTVRVAVDSAGSVAHAALENPGASKYFDHVAMQAAGRWQFAPAEHQESRQWMLRFEFTRSGAAAHAAALPPALPGDE